VGGAVSGAASAGTAPENLETEAVSAKSESKTRAWWATASSGLLVCLAVALWAWLMVHNSYVPPGGYGFNCLAGSSCERWEPSP
jgi:hypothetical protein